MISRKELKEKLNSLASENFSFSDSYDGYLKALNDILDWVDEQPQVEVWIPSKPDKPLEDENCVSKEFIEECKEVTKKYKKPMTEEMK